MNRMQESKPDLGVFLAAIESARHAIFVTDSQGHIEYVNPAFVRITGYSEREALGSKTSILQSGLMSAEYYQALWQAVLAGNSWSEAITNRRKNGELYEAWQIISPIADESGQPLKFVVIQEDVTERVETERALSELTQEYETVFTNTQDAIFLISVEAEDSEAEVVFRFLRLNTTHEKLTGFSTQQVRGKTPREVVGAELGEVLCANYLRCYDSRETVIYDEVLDLPAGRRTWRTRLSPVLDPTVGRVVQIIGTARDITLEQQLRTEQQFFFEVSPDLFAILTHDRRFHQASPAWAHLMGWEPSALIGRPLSEYLHPDDIFPTIDALSEVNEANPICVFEARLLTSNGEYRWTSWNVKCPSLQGMMYAVARDVEDNKRLQAQLIRMSTVDQLTGVSNRAQGTVDLHREAERVQRHGGNMSLIMCDIDHFKQINDSYGHAVGDEALRHTSEVMEQQLRTTDFFSRWGGEEFVALLPDTDLDGAVVIAERLREAVASSRGPNDIALTISLGVAEYSPEEDPEKEFLSRADRALYTAKEGGRNRVSVVS